MPVVRPALTATPREASWWPVPAGRGKRPAYRCRVDAVEGPGTAGQPSHGASPDAPNDGAGPYEFDPADGAAARDLWNDAHRGATDEWDATEALSEQAPQHGWTRDTPLVRELIFSAAYRLAPAGPGEPPGAVLRPQHNPPDGPCYPPAFRDRAAGALELLDTAAAAGEPAAAARAHDVQFEARHGNSRDHAERAAEAYRTVAAHAGDGRDPDDALDLAARSMLRAWTLTRAVGAWTAHADVADDVLQLLEDGLDRAPKLAGVVLPLLAAAVAPPHRKQPPRPDADAAHAARAGAAPERALVAYALRGDLARELTDLLRQRADDEAGRTDADRREVQIHLDEADASAGGVRQAALVDAIRVARDRGLDDLRDTATRRLQAMRPADLPMQTFRSTVTLPGDVVERYKRGFTHGRSWRPGLTYFLSTSPPTGSISQLRERTRRDLERPSLRHLFTTVHLNAQSLPTGSSSPGTDEAFAREVARSASLIAGTQGLILADGLARIAAVHGVPDQDALEAHILAAGAADQRLARSYARALRLFWSGDHEACVHLIVPKIEAAVRLALRECDVATFRTQVGASMGGYAGLQPLLAGLLDSGLDEDWHYFLSWLLLTPGANVRNDVAHGLLAEPSASYAALALRAAGLAVLIAPSSAALGWDDDLDGRRAADIAAPGPAAGRDVRARLRQPVPEPAPACATRTGPTAWAARKGADGLRAAAARLLDAADRLA